MPMEQDEYVVLLRALTTLVLKLDERFDAQEEFNRQQVSFNRNVTVAIDRVTVAIERIDMAIERIEVTLDAIKDMLGRGDGH
jgi:transcriptional regulator NrdR family protein